MSSVILGQIQLTFQLVTKGEGEEGHLWPLTNAGDHEICTEKTHMGQGAAIRCGEGKVQQIMFAFFFQFSNPVLLCCFLDIIIMFLR